MTKPKKKGIQLSYSAVGKYNECPKKYDLHYNQKLRTKYVGSALFFGGACDKAFERLLLNKKDSFTAQEKLMLKKSPKQIFDKAFKTTYGPEGFIDPSTSEYASYFNSDLDLGLLQEEDTKKILSFVGKLGFDKDTFNIETFIDEVKAAKRSKKDLSVKETKLFNNICWHSLRRKGHILVDAYEESILPHILKVHSLQQRISMKEDKDTYIGFIDFKCEFKDEPGVVYICDNKTSSIKYTEDSVRESEQLASYCEAEDNDKASYVVVEKKLRKREPIYRTQIIKDTIPEETFEKVFDKIGEVLYNIKEKKFPKLQDSKDCFFYGKKCDFYDYCWKNSIKGLVDKSKKEK